MGWMERESTEPEDERIGESEKRVLSMVGQEASIEDLMETAKGSFSNFRFKSFRKYQDEAIRYAYESKKRFTIIEAPTGSGKTLIGMVTGAMVGDVTYLIHSKVLQNQIAQDYPEAAILFGRSNYPCLMDDDLSADECLDGRVFDCPHKPKKSYWPPAKGYPLCPYDEAKRHALNNPYRVFITVINHFRVSEIWLERNNFISGFTCFFGQSKINI